MENPTAHFCSGRHVPPFAKGGLGGILLLTCLAVSSHAAGCDVNSDASTNVADVQLCVNQAISVGTCTSGDIDGNGACNVVDVQRVVNAALGGTCVGVSQAGFILRDATNTGLLGAGISESSLTNQGTITYGSSSNGQTIRGKRFTGTVTLSGNNITIDGSLFEVPPGMNNIALINTGTGNIIRNSNFRTSPNRSIYIQVHQRDGSLTVQLCNITQGENNITIDGGSLHLDQSFIHDPSGADNPAAHIDGIEVYGGSNHILERSTISNKPDDTVAPINIAPWYGATVVSGTTIQDNYLDGGNIHALIDQQSTGGVRFSRFLRNRMGGHTYNFGSYDAFSNYESRPYLQTEAALQANPDGILWPTGNSDPDRNIWYYCTNNPFGYLNLSPDRTGQTVIP
jgi:hypothetical protein